jgi:hypothetical protein
MLMVKPKGFPGVADGARAQVGVSVVVLPSRASRGRMVANCLLALTFFS